MIQLSPARIDSVVRQIEERDVPRLSEIRGFRGYTLLVDRSSGKAISTSYWETVEDMAASEAGGSVTRQRGAETGGAQSEPEVERFEVAFDTFRS